MDAIITLLKDKNFHLQKFYQLNEDEMDRFNEENFDNLEIFYQSRETILDLIRCIDRLVEAAAAAHTAPGSVSQQSKKEMVQVMGAKNELVSLILAQDLEILSMIERAKSNIIKELRQVSTSKKAVGAYHSGDSANKLDEKA